MMQCSEERGYPFPTSTVTHLTYVSETFFKQNNKELRIRIGALLPRTHCKGIRFLPRERGRMAHLKESVHFLF